MFPQFFKIFQKYFSISNTLIYRAPIGALACLQMSEVLKPFVYCYHGTCHSPKQRRRRSRMTREQAIRRAVEMNARTGKWYGVFWDDCDDSWTVGTEYDADTYFNGENPVIAIG
jgi:hypothetical protein